MENIVRIESIKINGIKNISSGTIEMDEFAHIDKGDFNYRNSILGIYGQNGSGKTSVLQATKILRTLLRGERLPENAMKYINYDVNKANLIYTFFISGELGRMIVIYDFEISQNIEKDEDTNQEKKYLDIVHEKIVVKNYDETNHKWKSKSIIYEGTDTEITLKKLIKSLKAKTLLQLETIRDIEKGSSRVFGEKIKNYLLEGLDTKGENNSILIEIINILSMYAKKQLLIIENDFMGGINLSPYFTINGYIKNDSTTKLGNILINSLDSSPYTFEKYKVVQALISQIDIVLNALVPNLHLKIDNVQNRILESGELGCSFEVVTQKEGSQKVVPLKYESEGIQRIISIVSALVASYNDPSICLMIDEFDSGVFEYLLGEIIQIYSESGKGQFIFTSHNLVALERLSSKSVIYTTSNPNNRFIYLKGLKPNNNIRDQYYKNIVLGSSSEVLYIPTKEYLIKRAFKKAGSINE